MAQKSRTSLICSLCAEGNLFASSHSESYNSNNAAAPSDFLNERRGLLTIEGVEWPTRTSLSFTSYTAIRQRSRVCE